MAIEREEMSTNDGARICGSSVRYSCIISYTSPVRSKKVVGGGGGFFGVTISSVNLALDGAFCTT